METMGNLRRSDYCGELRMKDIEREVVLMGWVQTQRNLGQLIFVDIRDISGISQVVFDETITKDVFEKAKGLKGEYVIAVRGKVRERSQKNPHIPTGDIEILAEELKILDTAQTPPIYVKDDDNVGEQMRLKYRFLDLRKPFMQKTLMTRAKIYKAFRDFLNDHRFIEIETPILGKSTPEGARDYIVPSRVNPGKFFALPQSPQLFKQLLMVSGMDRYYQITKCFRDEDLRANRQPEFTQVDIEMSFVDEDDVMSINEKLIAHIFKEILDIDIKLPLRRMPFDEAMDKYGVDKPDLRFGFLIHDVSSIFKNSGFKVFKDTVDAGNMVNAINIDGYQEKFTRKDITKLEEFAKTFGAKGLAWVKYVDNEFTGPIAKFFTDEEKEALIKEMDIKNNDLILFVADKKSVVKKTLGNLRNEIAKELNLNDPDKFELLWITDFPLFEYSEEEGRYMAMHHPFTHPKVEDIPYIEERKDTVKAKAYDIVINGEEIGGGSIRINNSDLQEKMFKALGFTKERAEEQFGFFIEAFKYGAPPHGGIAYGLDRFVQLLTKHDNIKDVIAFPKTQSATDLLTGAPSEVDDKQLHEVSIKVDINEAEKND